MWNFTYQFKIAVAISACPALLMGTLKEEPFELPPYVVTGSHLPIATEAAPVPLTVIGSDALDLWGDESPIQALRKQPFTFGAANTENDSNSGTGSAGLNLRGLGNLSTLTLINGRRAGGNSAFGFQHGGFADLNLIPSAAIQEIQVATDGTSVAYGSDAVAGTVNILLHDTFTGNRIDSSYSDTTDGDASEKTFSFLTGQDLGEKTHLVLLGSWYQRNAIYARDRDISKNADRRAQGGQNQGSPTFPGRIKVDGTEYMLEDGVTVPALFIAPTSTDPSDPGYDPVDDYRRWDSAEDLYNFSEAAAAIPEIERKSMMANLSHDITDKLQVWTEWLYTDSVFENGLAPAPWFGGTFPFAGFNFPFHTSILNAAKNSPHLPSGIASDELNQVNYRSFENGNLEVDQKKAAHRGLLGLRGQIGVWEWETAGLYMKTDLDAHWSGVTDETVVSDLITSGAFNPFATADESGPGYDNATALATAARQPTNHYNEEFWSYDLKANAPIFELPSGPVLFATGLEYREEKIDVDIDPLFESGANLGGAKQSSFSAQRSVASLFAETLVPVFSKGHQKLDLSLSARFEDYKDKPTGDSSESSNRYDAFVYKAALFYEPNEAIGVRVAYGTSFRAPTLTESYGGDVDVYPIYNDPLGFTPNSSRVDTIISGNPDLQPEESTNLNIGIVFEPNKARGWRLSVDYYRIETKDVIVNGAQYFVDANAAAQGPGFGTPDNFDLSAPHAFTILRDPGTGELVGIFANWFNAAESITDGIDYALNYKGLTSVGHWQASIGLNQVLSYELKASNNEPTQSFLGKMVDPRAAGGNIIGRGSIPRYKGYARLMWVQDGLTLGGTVNYIHSLDDNAAFTSDGGSRTIDSWTSLDLIASYSWKPSTGAWLGGTTLTLGIDNVTDEMPPFAAGAFADGYDSSLYSLEGRRISLSVNREF
jgi:outer membrane receptor protein involved in Fe transport